MANIHDYDMLPEEEGWEYEFEIQRQRLEQEESILAEFEKKLTDAKNNKDMEKQRILVPHVNQKRRKVVALKASIKNIGIKIGRFPDGSKMTPDDKLMSAIFG